MSLIDLPLVSGTIKNVNIVPSTLSAAKSQKVSPMPIAEVMEPKVTVIRNAKDQLKAPVIGPANELYSLE